MLVFKKNLNLNCLFIKNQILFHLMFIPILTIIFVLKNFNNGIVKKKFILLEIKFILFLELMEKL